MLSIAFIGAGGVNFGGVDPGAPWDHASRLQTLDEEIPLKIVGISDPDPKRLNIVYSERKHKIFSEVQIFESFIEMLDKTNPEVVFIGIPPIAHGEIELECAKRGIHMFIEKPLSCQPPSFVENLNNYFSKDKNLIVSVGYMLRYHKSVEFIKDFISKNNFKIANISARYNSAYVSIPKPMWWDTRRSGGPIVEQATHFCDLARYFGGEVSLDSVVSTAVTPSSEVGKSQLSAVPDGCEVGVPMEFRINRTTNALWKFETGAIGVLQHALLMKGTNYFTEFEIWCDGAVIRLVDPYSDACTVTINHFTDKEKVEKFDFKDDPYLTEDRAFLNAVKTGNKDLIKSSYEDAVKTYQFAWKIGNQK